MTIASRALVLMVITAAACTAKADVLKPVEDAELTLVLNNFEVLAEKKGAPATTPYVIRILRVADDGECDGKPETCPKRRLYVAVSEFGEAPKRALYRLPDAYEWQFSGWGDPVQGPEGHEAIPIRLERSVLSSTPKDGWFKKTAYAILVSPWGAREK